MRALFFLIWFTCIASIVSNLPAQETSVPPEADAFVLRAQPNTNFGSEPFLALKNAAFCSGSNADWDRKTYLRFSTERLNTNQSSRFVLTLKGTEGEGGTSNLADDIEFSVFGLTDEDPGEFWSETNISWNVAPQNNTQSGTDLLSNTQALGSFFLNGTGVRETIDFSSPKLDSFILQDSNNSITLIIVREFFDPAGDGYWHAFGSRESGLMPLLRGIDGLVGDINCDGSVDLLDVAPFVEALANGNYDRKADANSDGNLNLIDIAPFVDLLTN